MNESLLSRIGRMISASANSLVDSMENSAPELVMEHAIREVDQAIDDVRLELGKLEAGKHLTSKQLIKENEEYEQLSARIQLALQEQRDDLAEAAVARQMDIEAQIPVLEKALEDQKEQAVELNQYISALQAKKREMNVALKEYKDSQPVSGTSGGEGSMSPQAPERRVDKAESAFNRVMESVSGHPTRQSNADVTKLAELEELARRNRIHERLEKLKVESQG